MDASAEDVVETQEDRQSISKSTQMRSHTTDTPNTSSSANPPVKRNAFSELMSSKPLKVPKTTSSTSTTTASSSSTTTQTASSESSLPRTQTSFYAKHANQGPNNPRGGLLAYIQNPSNFPSTTVLRVTAHTVLIRDLFPKSTIHLLLLPRSPAHTTLHPYDAFTSPDFLSLIQSEAASALALATSELSRLLSPHSASSQPRLLAMDSLSPPSPLPRGRDFSRAFRVGVHAHPSMSNLHVHIVSEDMHGAALKHRKHYNSFTTDFFVPLADLPLGPDDRRRDHTYQNANLRRDLVCWRCGRGFGNRFKALKEHLDEEFRAWRAE